MFDVKDFPELLELRVRCRELQRTEDYFEGRFRAITGLSKDTTTEMLWNRPLTSDVKFRLEVLEAIAKQYAFKMKRTKT